MKLDSLYSIFTKAWVRPKTSNVWLYSDPHFADPEMQFIRKNYIGDEEQVKRINSKVGRYDTLIILGDIGDPSFIAKLHGYKVLIMGNHDKGASNYLRNVKQCQKLYAMPQNKELSCTAEEYDSSTTVRERVEQENPGLTHVEGRMISEDNGFFDEVYTGALMISDKIILSHQPIANLPPFLFNIHGHDHSNWFTGSRHLNVCAEHINYTPVALTEIIKSGVLKDVESIHRLQIDATVAKKKAK